MKKKILGTIVAGSLFLSTSAFSAGIGFANMQDIYEKSPLGKTKVEADEKAMQPKMEALKGNITELQTQINKYEDDREALLGDITDGDISKAKTEKKDVTKDELNARADLEKAMKEYQDLMQTAQDMTAKDADVFKAKLDEVSKNIATKHDLDAILPEELSLYNSSDTDVTAHIIEQMK